MTTRTDVLYGFVGLPEVESAAAEGLPKPVVKEMASLDSAADADTDTDDPRTLNEVDEARDVRVFGTEDDGEEVEVFTELKMEDEEEGGPTMIPVIEGIGGGPVSVLCRK